MKALDPFFNVLLHNWPGLACMLGIFVLFKILASPTFRPFAHSRQFKGLDCLPKVYIWMQGEEDARMGWGSVYEKSFNGVLEQLKQDHKVTKINYVVGRINDYWTTDKGWITFPANDPSVELIVDRGEVMPIDSTAVRLFTSSKALFPRSVLGSGVARFRCAESRSPEHRWCKRV